MSTYKNHHVERKRRKPNLKYPRKDTRYDNLVVVLFFIFLVSLFFLHRLA
ncbi:hypothetical protein [Zunongwangia sp. H14]